VGKVIVCFRGGKVWDTEIVGKDQIQTDAEA